MGSGRREALTVCGRLGTATDISILTPRRVLISRWREAETPLQSGSEKFLNERIRGSRGDVLAGDVLAGDVLAGDGLVPPAPPYRISVRFHALFVFEVPTGPFLGRSSDRRAQRAQPPHKDALTKRVRSQTLHVLVLSHLYPRRPALAEPGHHLGQPPPRAATTLSSHHLEYPQHKSGRPHHALDHRITLSTIDYYDS